MKLTTYWAGALNWERIASCTLLTLVPERSRKALEDVGNLDKGPSLDAFLISHLFATPLFAPSDGAEGGPENCFTKFCSNWGFLRT